MDKWLNFRFFPLQRLAYSCMMMMANGYKRMLDASQNRTGALYSLTAGDRHEYMVPDAFNTGYIGPNGPMTLDSNGDLSQGLENDKTHVIGKQLTLFFFWASR